MPSVHRCYRVLIKSFNSSDIKKGFAEVRELNRQRVSGDGSKYLHFAPWVIDNALRIVKVSLDQRPPCRILDLGSGPGYFIAMARAMGHEALGIDLGKHEIYNPLNKALGNNIIWHKITPEKPYSSKNIQGTFDLITAFSVTFDRHDRCIAAPRWTPEDWRLFFSNLKPLLHKGSKVFLQLNTRTFLGCRGSEFKIFRSGFLRKAGFECRSVGYRFVELFPKI